MDSQQTDWIRFNRQVIRLFALAGLVFTFFLMISIYRIGYNELLEELQTWLFSAGGWGPLLFIAIQMGQVVYPVIPGGITLVVGSLIFGPIFGYIYSFIGVTGGSILNFLLARKFGKTFARAFVSEKTYQKYYDMLSKGKRFEFTMAAAFALPGFPDDFLCMLAGLTEMTFKRFMTIYLIFKPATLYLYGAGGAVLIEWIVNRFFH